MPEQLLMQPNAELRVHDRELAHMGALLAEASMRQDLSEVIDRHTVNTGTENPNSIGSSGFFVAGEVPMSNESVYRQVGAEAIGDLALSGVIRNGATAEGRPHPRWGDRVFWHPGDNSKKIQTGGRFIIEADKNTAQNGWVTANRVSGVFAKDSDGIIKNIMPS